MTASVHSRGGRVTASVHSRGGRVTASVHSHGGRVTASVHSHAPLSPCPPVPLAKCIDRYAELSAARFEGGVEQGTGPIDPRLEQVVDRMFQRCFTDHEYRQAIGIALETRRMDILQRAITESVSPAPPTLSIHGDLTSPPPPPGQRSRDALVHSTDLPQPPEQPEAEEQGGFSPSVPHMRPCPPHTPPPPRPGADAVGRAAPKH